MKTIEELLADLKEHYDSFLDELNAYDHEIGAGDDGYDRDVAHNDFLYEEDGWNISVAYDLEWVQRRIGRGFGYANEVSCSIDDFGALYHDPETDDEIEIDPEYLTELRDYAYGILNSLYTDHVI